MPIIKSAIKKMRQDKVRTARNTKIKTNIKRVLKNVRKDVANNKLTSEAFSTLDRASKKGFISKRKAARLKSRMAKAASKTSVTGTDKAVRKPKAKVKTVK